MAALGSASPQHLKSALGGVGAAIGNTISQERAALAANPPTQETPAGQETPASETEVQPGEAAPPVEQAPEGAEVPVKPPEPTPAAPPPTPIPASAPAVTGDEEGKLSDADARNIQASISQLPTTDTSAPSFSAGEAPSLELEGNADPQKAKEQQAKLEETTTEAKAQGDRERAEPMGENEIYATLPPETLTADMAAGEAAAAQIEGNATAAIAEAGGGQDAAAILAQEEKGSEIQAAIASAQGEIAAQRQERDAQVAQEQEKSNQEIAQLQQENSAQQEAERGKAQGEVEQLRGEWAQEQDALIEESRTESDRVVGEGLAEVEAEKTAAESEATQEIEKGEAKAEEERAKGEEAAKQERQKGEEKAGGILGWVANAAASFFEGIKKAIQKAFEVARQLMRAAIEGAKKLATAAIEAGRKTIVGIIKRVGEAAIAIGDKLLAKFPETREKFRNAIQQKVKDAEAAVNQLAEGLNRGIQTALDLLGKGLDFALSAMEKGMLFVVDGVKSTVDSALEFGNGMLQTMGAFAALVPDIAANPGQWVMNLRAGAEDGVKNHLWGAFQTQTQNWFQGKVDSILGVPSEVLQQLATGGIDMGAIAQMAWNALKAAIPAALIGLLIDKVVSMIIPAVGAIKTIIESLVAAWGAVGSILSAVDAFVGFLKAVKGGNSGPQFGTMLAAAGVAVIDFVSNWLLQRLMKAARKFAAKLKGIAKGLAKKFKGKKKDKNKDRKKKGQDEESTDDKQQTKKQKKLDRAVSEIKPKTQALLKRGVSGIRLRAQLAIWRLKYGLSQLRVKEQGSRGIEFFAKVNPEAVFGNGVKIDGNELLKFIREVVQKEVLSHTKVKDARQEIQNQKKENPKGLHLPPGKSEYFPAAAKHYRETERPLPEEGENISYHNEKIKIGNEETIVNEQQKNSKNGVPYEKTLGLGTYPEIAEELNKLISQDSQGLSPARVAQAMQELVQKGQLPDYIENNTTLNKKDKKKLREKITRLTWLMFGGEAERRLETIAISPMILELISKGKMDLQEAFNNDGNPIFPMAMEGAVEASRRLDADAEPQTFCQRPGNVGTSGQAEKLKQKEIDAIVRWVNEIGIQGNEINGDKEEHIKEFISKKVKEFYLLHQK
jgi:hypothetical protein